MIVIIMIRKEYIIEMVCCWFDAGQEPYRAFGLTVHEHEILDDESLRTVARAKAQYNKMYREVRL